MVSVLLLSWNHEAYIEQALLSIINQTYTDIEILYLDNGSFDNSFLIAEDILKNTSISYKIFKREKNYGTAENLNFLFKHSKGEFICTVSADDWLNKRNTEEKLKLFSHDPSLGIADSNGYKYYDDIKIYEPFKVVCPQKEKQFEELLKRNYLSGIGCLIKREVLEVAGLWDETLLAEDWALWIRIAAKFSIASVNKYLFFYRKHANAISGNYKFMYNAKMQLYHTYENINPHKKETIQCIKNTYLSNKVMSNTSIGLLFEIIKNYRGKKFFKLLVKSLLPVSWKQNYFKKSLIRRFKNISPQL